MREWTRAVDNRTPVNMNAWSCFTLSCRSEPTRQTSQHQYSHAPYAVAQEASACLPLSARTYTFIPAPMAGMGMQGPRAPLPVLGRQMAPLTLPGWAPA